MSSWSRPASGGLAGAVAALALSACGASGGGATGPAAHASPARRSALPVPVAVRISGFPLRQRLAATVDLAVAVRNAGTRALPDVAVTICERSCAPSDQSNRGTAAEAFAYDIHAAPNTADPSRPLWIVDRGPGGCALNCNQAGGDLGGGVTASTDTWALGRLAPGHTARFTWRLTPVVAGVHVVAWEIAGDLSGAVRTSADGGSGPARGTRRVTVSSAPPRLRVTPQGRVITIPTG